MQAHVLGNIASDTPAIQWSKIKERWPHLNHCLFEKIGKRRQVDLMIGSDHPLFHLALREVPGSRPSDPIARLTNLGWVCFGPFGPTLVRTFRQETRTHFTRTYRTNQNEAVQQQAPGDILRHFWELESLGIKEHTDQPMTIDDKAAIKLVSQVLENKDGRYQVTMPWKDGEPKLDNNFEAAMHRL